MKLVAIDQTNIVSAIGLLLEGFRGRSPSFWESGIKRSEKHAPQDANWPIGYLLERNEKSSGVILTATSRRSPEQSAPQHFVNLSSWYVAESHRNIAPMMLFRVLSDQDKVYTDLTPSASVMKINERLGFTRWNEGVIISLWPWSLLLPSGNARILALRDVPTGAMPDWERQLLEDHQKMGCLCGALFDGNRYEPWAVMLGARSGVIRRRLSHDNKLMPVRRVLKRFMPFQKLRVAHVIYARNRQHVISNLRPLMKHLRGAGLAGISVDADARDCPKGALFRPWGLKCFRGPIERSRIDYAYSELIYLRLPPF